MPEIRRHVAVLVNPVAGRGAGEAQGLAAVARLRERGVEARDYEGTDAADTVRLAAKAIEAEPDVLAVVGGEGTLASVLLPVLESGVALALLGGGTGNDLARAHGIPADPVGAADVILDGRRRRVDTGTITADDGTVRHFLTIVCAGFDSRVAERTNRMTWPRGAARYVVAKYLEAIGLRTFDYVLLTDGDRLERPGHLVAVGLTPYYGGGTPICPDADPADGLLDVTLVGPTGRRGLVTLDPLIQKGQHLSHPLVTSARAASVRLEAPAGLVAYADGERVGPLPLTVAAHRERLTLCVP
ncbi:hypothetical protein L1785_11505 [Antribacter sp. KLBMP9083]|uniref:DAGKc domain-containing protein n=1 Tax=Antribacter soli TaxID=2910976 RepID=A0AA41QDS8_9MICO|nr:diacylglycerol kinase family protein [Antribacter soli]MCF4121609.1 hypothetical protein [Antribacter soli]